MRQPNLVQVNVQSRREPAVHTLKRPPITFRRAAISDIGKIGIKKERDKKVCKAMMLDMTKNARQKEDN